MTIAIIVIISSIVGLIGFIIGNSMMFYIGGAISFFDFLRYSILTSLNEKKLEIQQIKENRSYQRGPNKPIKHLSSEKELKGLIRYLIILDTLAAIITYSFGFAFLYYFFSWKAFIWIGIVVGLGYSFTVLPKYLNNK